LPGVRAGDAGTASRTAPAAVVDGEDARPVRPSIDATVDARPAIDGRSAWLPARSVWVPHPATPSSLFDDHSHRQQRRRRHAPPGCQRCVAPRRRRRRWRKIPL